MTTQFGRPIAVLALAFLAIAGVLLSLCFWFGEGHGASFASLARIHPGMVRDQVVDLLGLPGTINHSQDNRFSRQAWSGVPGMAITDPHTMRL